MADNVLEFTDGNFQSEVIDSDQPVLVDFWAPTIEELASDYDGRARVGKMNTDENPQTATTHQISAIPTVMLFKGGEIVERFVGVTPKEKFSEALDSHLS